MCGALMGRRRDFFPKRDSQRLVVGAGMRLERALLTEINFFRLHACPFRERFSLARRIPFAYIYALLFQFCFMRVEIALLRLGSVWHYSSPSSSANFFRPSIASSECPESFFACSCASSALE